ncbi:hypothetical protein N9X33_00945 [Alphaproteobacteria bacterium]|nr:hypothetical protein [Alphaproteobacteria bacterium]
MSRARRAANRQNALKSTGPRTGAGKRRASENALRHGLSQPIGVKQVCDALDRLQNVLIKAGYQPTHAFRVALCLLDYDRVELAEDELHHRMMCMASAYAMMEPRIPNSLMPLTLDNQRDIDIGAFHYISYKTGGGRHIGKIPSGGLRGDAFWRKIVSGKHFDRYRKRSLNQLLKALKAQNDDYKV